MDEDFFVDLEFGNKMAVISAAYTIYVEMTPKNKKTISQREFYTKFVDNWEIFANIEKGKDR